MGFRTARKLYLLVFPEDSDLYGLEITAKGATLGERRDYIKNKPSDPLPLVDFELEFLIEHITDWNLEDEAGNTLPISAESMYTLDDQWVKLIISTFTDRVITRQVGEGLGKESSGGDSSEITPSTEASLPMEAL